MRVLITGGAGLLGSALVRVAPHGVEVHATVRSRPAAGTSHRVDLADGGAVAALVTRVRPQLVIHTAYAPSDPARGIVTPTEAVAIACAAAGARLVHLSSDRVLDGDRAPYDEAAAPCPIEPYGEAKAEAERIVGRRVPGAAVIRTSLIVGTDPPDRISAGVIEALGEGREVALFADELRCPIHVDDLAAQIWEIAALDDFSSVWNLVGPEAVSRFALGLLVARRHGLDAGRLRPTLNREHAERRPRDLRLTTSRADRMLGVRARPISEALLR